MKIFLCPAWQILIIRNIFPPWEQIKTFPIQQSFEKSLHSANCQRCVKATLTLLLIYFRGIIRVIMKIEMREIKFSWGVIAWDFLLILYLSKIVSKWLGKVSFSAKNQKDMLDDGTRIVCSETLFVLANIHPPPHRSKLWNKVNLPWANAVPGTSSSSL